MKDGGAIRKIVIVGNGLRAWLPAAYLSARLPKTVYSISVVEYGKKYDIGSLVARPMVRRMHQLLQISEQELAQSANAKLVLGVSVPHSSGQTITMPYGQYGVDRAGAEFHQYWRRAFGEGQAKELSEYNLAYKLDQAGVYARSAPKGLPAIDYGYSLSQAGYCELLKAHALGAGVSCHEGAAGSDGLSCGAGHVTRIPTSDGNAECDMVIDANMCASTSTADKSRLSGWHGNILQLPNQSPIPGIELQLLIMAMERLIGLWPDRQFLACETGEYNRLDRAVRDRVADMELLFSRGVEEIKQSAALARKIKVFSRRGRIPIEDHEVFSKSEWLAALIGSGIMPVQHDRLADRIPIGDLSRWLRSIDLAITQTVERAKEGRRVR
ncbi:MAG: tryptophan 7-halogenase [Hyphomonadaceae bacterium]